MGALTDGKTNAWDSPNSRCAIALVLSKRLPCVQRSYAGLGASIGFRTMFHSKGWLFSQVLAHHVAGEPADDHVLSQFRDFAGEEILDCDVGVLDEWLLEKARVSGVTF